MGKWSKKVAVSILMIVMVIGILPGMFLTVEGRAYVTQYAGAGTSDDPYLIATADQLVAVNSYLNLGASYKLIADIDLSDYLSANIGISADYPFTGSINGNGHKITNATGVLFGFLGEGGILTNMALENIDIPSDNFLGLGGLVAVNYGTISNSYVTGNVIYNHVSHHVSGNNIGGLVAINYGTINKSYAAVNVSGNDYIGGLVGYNNGGTISNSHAAGSVNGNDYVGGLVGYNNGGTISNSHAAGSVSGDIQVGGLVGNNHGGMISNSYAAGSVSGDIQVGGLVGNNHGGTISNSYATGSVVNEYVNIDSRIGPGGLVGLNNGTINKSYATGSVRGAYNAGGLVSSNGESGIISNCYATGSVWGGIQASGLALSNHGTISNCYATGSVSAEDVYNHNYRKAGFVIGDNGTIRNSFNDKETSGIITFERFEKSTVEMKSQDTYTGSDWSWDFQNIWGIDPLLNDGYPYLRASLVYAGNQNTTGEVPVDSSSYGLGVTASVYGNTGNLARIGYTFVGWNTSEDGNGRSYTGGDTLTLAGETILYAQWTVNTYEVTFNADGGVAVSLTPLKQYDATYGQGADGTTSEPLPTPTRTGYTFDGWYTATGGAGTQVTDATIVSTAGPHTLYAKWTANMYTVTFSAEEGELDPQTQTKRYNATYGKAEDGADELLPTPTRTGYTFGGWYTATGGTGTLVTNTTPVTATIAHTLYAKWTVNTYTVTFNAEGGVAVTQTPMKQYDATYGKAADGTTNEPLPTTTRIGYTFEGWYTATGGTGTLVTNTTPVTATIAHTLYAKWTVNTYEVTFHAEGGEAVSQTPIKQYDATYGKAADGTTNEPLPTTTRIGYTFGGWYTAIDGTGTQVTDATIVSTATDHTLYAMWDIRSAITSVSVSPATASVVQGATLQLTATVTVMGGAAQTVTWSSSDPKVTVSASGLVAVTADAVTGDYTLTATSTVDTSKSGTATITATAASTIPVTPSGGGSGGALIIDTPLTATDGTLTLPAGKAGKASSGDSITIDIPAGATDKELKLTIDKMLDTQQLLTSNEVLASPIYEILKNFSDNFSKPVMLTFTFDPTKVKSNQKVAVFYYDEVKKIWVEVPGGKISGNNIIVEVDHFTKYAVLVVDADQPTDTVKESNISDIAGHWAEAAIRQAVNSGIVTGYTDGTFKPNQTVTRAEFAVMLMNALKPQEQGTQLTFADSTKIGAWAQKAVAQAVQAGILNGFDDGTFRPNTEITRIEMAVMLANALGQSVEADTTTGFADDKDIPVWAKSSIAIVKQAGIIQGKSDNKFAPQDQATRAEAVTVLLRMLAQMD